MSIDSPNFEGLDRWSFDPRRVEKPWGWELIWAEAEAYVGTYLELLDALKGEQKDAVKHSEPVIELVEGGKNLGTWLVSPYLRPQEVSAGGKTFRFFMA